MTTPVAPAEVDRLRRRLLVNGVVQGVGFRPFVYVMATELSLTGSVANDSGGVVIEVEGARKDVDEFARRLVEQPPPLALVEAVRTSSLPVRGGTGFSIAGSSRSGGTRTLASPDVATCADCLSELTDPADRRYRHPFITCTNCGPRFTIIEDLPYDRPSTTMARFAMCEECAAEYADPTDRRFHAQPIACPSCGPRLELVDRSGSQARGEAALAEARRLLAAGGVVAVKGLGGYHLACDAGNDAAVARLRQRKRRGDKPFAVMASDVATARRLVEIDPAEQSLLIGPRRPIVLLARRGDQCDDRHGEPAVRVSECVAPGNPDLGVMLPSTPLHTLLLGLPGDTDALHVLVMTSGNLAGEPIAFDDEDALRRLEPLSDAWLRHDRPIKVPCDDSVTRVVDGVELPIRRSRGYAPLPVALPVDVPATLAVGADLKNTCCLAQGRYAWLSQHIGDMDDLATLEAFGATEQHLERLTGVSPVQLVADQHPAYRSTGWARQNAGSRPLRTAQHHHAHVAAVMAEHGLDGSAPVIGIAFDGTGYGSDGAVWGGEVLLADYKGFQRFGHLGYVWLPGGDAAVRRPYRMALAHLAAAGLPWEADLAPVQASTASERDVLAHQLATGFGCAPTSSMGRLFDAVAALAGVRQVVDFEAQAAIEFEAMARRASSRHPVDRFGAYEFSLTTGTDDALVADASPLVRAVVADVRGDVPAATISCRFHAAVARLVGEFACRARAHQGLETVILAGGVFQNATLLTGASRVLQQHGFTVMRPRLLPPNDGGLALGQILIGAST